MADLVARARGGDADAFAELVAPLRGELTAHCYRMLGSFHEAEDAVQDSLTRAWRGLDGFDDRGWSIRPWLYRIATNRCLSRLRRASRRELPTGLGSSTEVEWVEPYPDARLDEAGGPEATAVARDTMRLAFVTMLQHLPPQQRAVLLLREVLELSAAETAAALDLSVAAINSTLQRARRTRDARLGTRPDPVDPPATVRELAARYAAAWESGDVDGVVALLAADVRYSMPPLPRVYAGRRDVEAFLRDGPMGLRWRFVPTSANRTPAFGTYRWDDDAAAYLPGGLDLITVHGDRVTEVVSFLDADLTDFGLPARLT